MNTATLPLPTEPQVNGRVSYPAIPEITPTRENSEPRSEVQLDPTPTKRSRGLILKRVAIFVLLVLAGAGAGRLGYQWWIMGRYFESTDDAYVGGDVTVIAPKVPGFIGEVLVKDNQEVHAGDLLVKLDDRDYKASLARAEAAVANEKASLTNLDATLFLQQAVVAEAEAEVTSADAEVNRAEDDQARYRKLSTNGAVSVQSLQKAEAIYKQAVAAGVKSRASLAAAQRQLAVIGAQKEQALAGLAQTVAERDLARLNVSYTELRAPIDGLVGNRSAHTGAYASVGAQLISLVPVRGLWVDANFKESQLARVCAGEPASVRLDVSGQTFQGHVVSLAPATGAEFSVLPPENATGNFTKIVQRVAVRIMLDHEAAAAGQLRPGLSVTAEVDGRSAAGKAGL